MSRTYTTTLDISLGGDTPTWEGEATVAYAVTWGVPETGPTYACGGTPADPDEIDGLIVTHIDGQPVVERQHGLHEAETLENHIEGNDRLIEALLINAIEVEAERDDQL